MKRTKIPLTLIGILLLNCLILNACGSSDETTTPSLQPETIQTNAVATFASGLTQTAIAFPTETPSPSPTATTTSAPSDTPQVSTTLAGEGQPTVSCYRLAFVSDVTIPDNTTMNPGEVFTKTWRVRNSGSCDWEIGFQFKLTYHEAMGAAALTLGKTVHPGEETDLSIMMTAPTEPGSHQGNWRMATSAGTFFGDEVYVLIVVSDSGTTTATPTETQNPETETPTTTQEETAES